jgi:hypothetical protein
MIACFAGPSFHDARAAPGVTCACATVESNAPDATGNKASPEISVRRSMPDETLSGFILIPPWRSAAKQGSAGAPARRARHGS